MHLADTHPCDMLSLSCCCWSLLALRRSSPRANAVRMVAVWDGAGRLRVVRENGTVRHDVPTNRSALAAAASGCLANQLFMP